MKRITIAADCMKRAADCQARGDHCNAVCWMQLSIALRKGRVESLQELEKLGHAVGVLAPQEPQPQAKEDELNAARYARKYLQQMALNLAKQQPF
ncbi:hypothetical protein [Ferrimonas futtsuensis]|uniref:hypothetical protein n=1 Tax=Ferrimonas futtsuensis TaxID=364764 RepID=UPI000484DE81|nr:hypothetical protein [Ferrimonas futtsuensis]